ncbi:hypothetical protein PTSG_09968 [Salpingoeca rosetta]|uniref:PID domain-containing protein n=1 Tax=Salpingoeca rosetta (strain ATCC 50818 / BSB-021) TaxID=946362 RepID=F2UNP1_SALR5|nr:uncharacterized protein PTSG_09968 [Salpingoeca rosetta]EGD79246.1 hypothetical protein PTSG_09968 [Salpingoeca rosetta]|eukprot:XP_004989331.1 hypothetical protein PTSG_09968 [Salpingoeca rosetta]
MNSSGGGANQPLAARKDSFLTAPDDGWLHSKFAMQYGEGVFFSFPVTYVGRHPLARSLRSVEFPVRNKIVREAICRVREEARTRPPIERQVPAMFSEFLDAEEPEIKMQDIVVNISSAGIVLATEHEDAVIAFHRMTTISFAAGGDFEDYDMVAYVAKSRLGRMCYVFDCGAHSNQVLATIGQAFVQAGEEAEAQEYEEFDDEYGVYAEQVLTEQEYQDLYGVVGSHPTTPTYADPTYADPAVDYDTGTYADTNAIYDNRLQTGGADGHVYNMPDMDEANPDYHEFTVADVDEANPDYHEVSVDAEGAVQYDVAQHAGDAAHQYAMGHADGDETYASVPPRPSLKERLRVRASQSNHNGPPDTLSTSPTYATATDFASSAVGSPTYDMGMHDGHTRSPTGALLGNATYGMHADTGNYAQAHTFAAGDEDMEEDPTYTLGQADGDAASRGRTPVSADLTYDMATKRRSTQDPDATYAMASAFNRDSRISSPSVKSATYDVGDGDDHVYNNRTSVLSSLPEDDADFPDADAAFTSQQPSQRSGSKAGRAAGDGDGGDGGEADPWEAIQNETIARKGGKAYDPKVAGSYTDAEYLEEYVPTYLEVEPSSKSSKKGKGRRFFGLFGKKKGGKAQAKQKSKAAFKAQSSKKQQQQVQDEEEYVASQPGESVPEVVYEDPDAEVDGDGPYARVNTRDPNYDDDDDDDSVGGYEDDDDDDEEGSGKTPAEIASMYSTVSKRRTNPPSVPPKQKMDEALVGSIRVKPLQGKADFLVRKLNAEAGSLSVGKQQKRQPIPSWNFIDPASLSHVKET